MLPGSAVAYLKPIRKRKNLTVRTHALATRVLLEGDRAVGVSYRAARRGGEAISARCEKEVVLCGGAINSPQLMELSGIGDGARLADCGIAVANATDAARAAGFPRPAACGKMPPRFGTSRSPVGA
mgnify:CR=1 FL=1